MSLHLSPLDAERLRETGDFLEVKSSESKEAGSLTPADFKRDAEHRGRRDKRSVEAEPDEPIRMRDGSVFDVGKISNYKVLRDDQVVELRNPRSGKLEISIVKASALPSDFHNYDTEYRIVELDKLAISIEKHDEKPKEVKVDWEGNFHYPLLGKVEAKGLTLVEVEALVAKKMRDYVNDPEVTVSMVQKSDRSRILLFNTRAGAIQFADYSGQKILDLVPYDADYQKLYDKVCVLRKQKDGSMMCIVVDMEYMFKSFDLRQNIPLSPGDIVVVKKMPPLMGKHISFWLFQVYDWLDQLLKPLNNLDGINQRVQDIRDWELFQD